MAPTVAQLLSEHSSLSISCTDRLYINGYVPRLYTSGQLVWFLREHLGKPFVSPVLLHQLRTDFIKRIEEFAKTEDVPMVKFPLKARKDDIANERRARFDKDHGVVFIGVAQEKSQSFKAKKNMLANGVVTFDFSRQPVYVNQYYFYVEDREWGPAFVKVGSYLPFPVKLCLNGHEWAKRQLAREGIGFEALDNGFLSCEDPERLQQICDTLDANDIFDFFMRWSRNLPWPLGPDDWNAEYSYDHRLTIWQAEFSLTHVFDRPVQGRHFFEQVIRDNIDLGRPDRVGLIFPHRITRTTPAPNRGYRTRVITAGVNPSLHAEYKTSHVKQYFKEEKALRTETTINDPADFYLKKGIESFDQLREIGNGINHRLIEIERVSDNCVLSGDELDRLHTTTREDGQPATALRFGDKRVMALLHALCMFLHVHIGFRNKDLRRQVASLLGLSLDEYTPNRMTYDLRRLRRKGLIRRLPGTNLYVVTPHGLRVAYFITKLHIRIMRPASASFTVSAEAAPKTLSRAFARVDAVIEEMWDRAGFRAAA